MPSSPSYAAVQQAGSLTAASITGVTAATAATFLTIDKRRQLLSIVSTLNQAIIITRNGGYWHTLPASGTGSYPSAIFDLGTDSEFIEVGDSFAAYAISATPTTGVLWGMAT